MMSGRLDDAYAIAHTERVCIAKWAVLRHYSKKEVCDYDTTTSPTLQKC